jgi:hypothetical protein
VEPHCRRNRERYCVSAFRAANFNRYEERTAWERHRVAAVRYKTSLKEIEALLSTGSANILPAETSPQPERQLPIIVGASGETKGVRHRGMARTRRRRRWACSGSRAAGTAPAGGGGIRRARMASERPRRDHQPRRKSAEPGGCRSGSRGTGECRQSGAPPPRPHCRRRVPTGYRRRNVP